MVTNGAALAGLDEGKFTESHELDRKWQVSKAMIGRRLSQEEAKRLLAKFDPQQGLLPWTAGSLTSQLLTSTAEIAGAAAPCPGRICQRRGGGRNAGILAVNGQRIAIEYAGCESRCRCR